MPHILSAEKISKMFAARRGRGNVLALSDASFTIDEGEFIALVGPSGCGKSTLARIIAGIEGASDGDVYFRGERVQGPSWKRGMIFQHYALLPWKTVFHNVELGLRYRGFRKPERARRVQDFIELVGLAGFADAYPHELSGGMKQRAALARTLVNDPELVLLDEPLISVDAQTRRILQSELLKIWGDDRPREQRKTMIYITHSIEEAVLLSDRIFVMSTRPGRVIKTVDNDIPRPRTDDVQATAAFGEICRSIWSLIEPDARKAMLYAD
ncbi:MAG: ABC transporter ATP-binding protein [Candidatus Rokubacteria bacterium]|nr:ABC transporter ATP-binding protein [Candidatus Rokubacteria bacterium]